jgi:hemerythrin-like metal-binding protein
MEKDAFKHYRIGVTDIDDEHFHVVQLVNKIKTCLKNGTEDVLLDTARLLCTTIARHMEHEEQLMDEINFPFVIHHKGVHKEIIAILEAKLAQLHTPHNFLFFAEFVERMMLAHFDNMDLQFAPYVPMARKG